jgi:transcription initiation factor TFIID subunit 1
LSATSGRAVLHLDATRKTREKTGKFYHYVRRVPPKAGGISIGQSAQPA